MFSFLKHPEFIAIGDSVVDAFIRLKQAEVIDSINHATRELCITFGDKVPYEFVKVVPGVGNSANAAVSAARLGLTTAFITDIGGDQNGKDCLNVFRENNVSIKYITIHKDQETNYHYVLWYGDERTILVKHQQYPYKLPTISPAPKWIYLSSLGENSLDYHGQISNYLMEHPEVKLAFQPGTYQMKFGVSALKDIYTRSEIFFCNLEESQRILNTEEKDIKKLLQGVAHLGPKKVVITDGPKGAYAYDGTTFWFMPLYPDPKPPLQRTGAGDAFSSAVTVALAKGKSLEEALTWGPVNSMSVVQHIGAREGLLTEEKLLKYLRIASPDYKPKKI